MNRKKAIFEIAFNLLKMAFQEGFEPPTDSLEGCCSIQLSY